jgi:hypothetical protein
MKLTWIILASLSFQASASANCKVAVVNSGYGTKELKSILESKGYQLVNESEAQQVFSINAAHLAWDDSAETFSYAAPTVINTRITGSENCPPFDPWKFFTTKPIFQKRAAIRSMLKLMSR